MSIPKEAIVGRSQYDMNVMEAAYNDVRSAANQVEDQLNRAFEVSVCGLSDQCG